MARRSTDARGRRSHSLLSRVIGLPTECSSILGTNSQRDIAEVPSSLSTDPGIVRRCRKQASALYTCHFVSIARPVASRLSLMDSTRVRDPVEPKLARTGQRDWRKRPTDRCSSATTPGARSGGFLTAKASANPLHEACVAMRSENHCVRDGRM